MQAVPQVFLPDGSCRQTTHPHNAGNSPYASEMPPSVPRRGCPSPTLQNRILLNRAKALNGNTVNVITSKQQLELCKYLHGEINKSCDRYNIDIVVKDITIEYDGKGHRLRENFSHISEENFNKQEEKRDNIIMSNGYKIIRISNLKDIKINFKVLVKYLRLYKNIVKRTNMHKVQIDVKDMSIYYQNKVIYGGKYNNGG